MEVARAETDKLIEQGAVAVMLTGSHARGDAHPESDLDLRVVGDGPDSFLVRREEFLVSIAWLTADEHREAFTKPDEVGQVIPGWRGAVILHDPKGVAKEIQAEARQWRWDDIRSECDEWVADQITDLAEEVHTLIGNLDMGQNSGAAAIRSQIALHLAHLLAVHLRLLYTSENDLWDVVAEEMGNPWGKVQAVALGLEGNSFRKTCEAALELFGIAAALVVDTLDDRRLAIVGHACKLAGHPLADQT
jgi:hypothetical protein